MMLPRFIANFNLICGSLLLSILLFCAFFAGFLSPYSPIQQHRDYPFAPPTGLHSTSLATSPDGQTHSIRFLIEGDEYRLFGFIPCRMHLFGAEGDNRVFLLGTDALGRDVFSRLLHGAQLSLAIPVIALLISVPFAVLIGWLAGYYGGATDFILMRLIELFLALPAIYLIIALRTMLPLSIEPEKFFFAIVAVISAFGWAYLARIVRGMVLSLRERNYVQASIAFGAGGWRIFCNHIAPHLAGVILIQAALATPSYILAEITLSYLGLGVPDPLPSWGNMLSSTTNIQLLIIYWWNLMPLAAIFITSFAFQLLAEGLRRSLDPHKQTTTAWTTPLS
jgi:peptide/nickel transport system permease protein